MGCNGDGMDVNTSYSIFHLLLIKNLSTPFLSLSLPLSLSLSLPPSPPPPPPPLSLPLPLPLSLYKGMDIYNVIWSNVESY